METNMKKIPNGIYTITLFGSDSLVSMLPGGGDRVSLLPWEESRFSKWVIEQKRDGVYTVRDEQNGLFLSHDERPQLNSMVFGAKRATEWCVRPMKTHSEDAGELYIFSIVENPGQRALVMGRSSLPIYPPQVALVYENETPHTECRWVLRKLEK